MVYARETPDGQFKVCSRCRADRPTSEYHKNRATKDGFQNLCRSCRDATGEDRSDAHRWRRYRITPEQFRARLASCGGRCEVCGRLPHPSIGQLDCDHDHTTGKFRGLLCRNCNVALRCENPAILRALADYLERHAA